MSIAGGFLDATVVVGAMMMTAMRGMRAGAMLAMA